MYSGKIVFFYILTTIVIPVYITKNNATSLICSTLISFHIYQLVKKP